MTYIVTTFIKNIQLTLSLEIESYIKGYHEYKEILVPKVNEKLKSRTKPENIVDKYVVCTLKGDEVVGKTQGKDWSFRQFGEF